MRLSGKLISVGTFFLISSVTVTGCAESAHPAAGKGKGEGGRKEVNHERNRDQGGQVESETFTLPIDEFSINPHDYHLIEKAKIVLINRCMKRLGSNYSAPSPEGPIFQASRRYGVVDVETAATHGYHMPRVESGSVSNKSRNLTAKERELMFGVGNQPKDAQGRDVEASAGGCIGEAELKIAGGKKPETAIGLAQNVDTESYAISLKDPLLSKAFNAWSGCMKDRGYEYDSPLTAISDPRFQEMSEPSEREKRVAVADVHCKRETKLIEIWSKIEREAQSAMIRKNAKTLQLLQSFQAKEMQNARKVLSDSQ